MVPQAATAGVTAIESGYGKMVTVVRKDGYGDGLRGGRGIYCAMAGAPLWSGFALPPADPVTEAPLRNCDSTALKDFRF
jgi:hypothetical protein